MLSRLLILTLTTTLVLSQRDVEESMTAAELIRHGGYPVEVHDVITEDGYILCLLRIPHGRNHRNSTCRRPPILLVHGLLSDSAEFVENPPKSSPGMILADAGFDVFLLNHRGTTHSQRHVRLNKSDPAFWQYSLDEFARYDATAAVDKALKLSGATSLHWNGHSQGTLVGFLMLADRPEYNHKIRAMFQLAPVGTLHYSTTFGKLFTLFLTALRPILIEPHEIGFRIPWLVGGAARILCTSGFSEEWCAAILCFVFGPPAKSENSTRIPLYLSNFFVSTSSWTLLQIGNNGYHNHVNHFNGSPEINMQRYGSVVAPSYNYSNIDTDVYLFVSRNDWLTTPKENEKFLVHQLTPGVIKDTFEIPEYNHIDYAGATDVADRVYSKIINIVHNYEQNMCVV